jgi:hypothetical protein
MSEMPLYPFELLEGVIPPPEDPPLMCPRTEELRSKENA